jgi:hypothetical protein
MGPENISFSVPGVSHVTLFSQNDRTQKLYSLPAWFYSSTYIEQLSQLLQFFHTGSRVSQDIMTIRLYLRTF